MPLRQTLHDDSSVMAIVEMLGAEESHGSRIHAFGTQASSFGRHNCDLGRTTSSLLHVIETSTRSLGIGDRGDELKEANGENMGCIEHTRPEEELQQLVDSVPQVLVELEADGTWIHANRRAREYTGLTLDEYRSVDVIARVIHPDDVEKMRHARKVGFPGFEPFELEARMRGEDGSYRWFLFRYRPLISEGRVIRWYGSATEINSRKQEEDNARKEIVRLAERTRIAQELHDTLLQSFFLASLQLGMTMSQLPCESVVKADLNRILELLEQGIEDGRNAILDLRSADCSPMRLSEAFHRIPDQVTVTPHVDIQISVIGRERLLNPTLAHEIYRIGREALVNASCHSGSKTIELRLEYKEKEILMQVADKGKGIDPVVLLAGKAGHCGLRGMRERASRIGASFCITSDSGGTEIRLVAPNPYGPVLADVDVCPPSESVYPN